MLYDGIDGNELDLADIEAHLYSQVFHSNNQETPIESDNQDFIDNMRPPNRYFQPGRTSKFINNVNNNNNKKQKTQIKTTNFMKPTTQRQQRDLSTTTTTTTLNQVVLVSPFICLKEIKKSKRKQNKRARYKERRRVARLELQLQKVLQESNTAKPIKPPPPLPLINSVDIITLSDSENEDEPPSTGEIKEDSKLTIQISKDTTTNNDNTANDDVIFVEPPPIEVINLIEESPGKKSAAIETSSLKNEQRYRPCERKELLSTPESTTSNDFMENQNIDLQQNQFNFSLHGADFVNNNNAESNKPTTSNSNNNNVGNVNNRIAEICETESTCSTIDVNSLKATVFKEVEFPREDLFSEANLENFGNLITPNRTNKTRIETSTPIQMINNNNKSTHNSCSSSSSESDFDDNNLQIDKIKKQMNLPNLSPIQAVNNNDGDDDDNNSKTSKKTKTPKIGSKFDLIENDKKTKKRKSSESNNNSDRRKLTKNKRRKSENPEKSSNKDNADKNNSIIDGNQESDTLILEASRNESIDNYPENTIKANDGDDCDDNNVKTEEVLKDFEIVDEVNNTDNEPIIISESESELSAINEQECRDLKLINCSNIDKQSTIVNVDNKNEEVNLKNATLLEVQQAMSDDPKLWQISERDRNYIRKGGLGKRCAKCREIGHISTKCPNRRDPPKCRLCGGRGHLVYRCPNTMCVQCGAPGNSSTYCTHCYKFRELYCHICGMAGHVKDRCPDLWRRYHLTTESGPLIARQGASLKPKEQLWCSSCARSGHLEHVCNFTYTPYAKYDPQIYYYHDIYENFENIEQLYPSTANYQYNQASTQFRSGRYLDRDRYYNYNKEYGDADNGLIGRSTNVEAYFYNNNNNQRGFSDSQPNSTYHQDNENVIKRENHYFIFHNKSFTSISYFLRAELRNLYSLYRDIENVVRNLKNAFNEQSRTKVGSFYRLLNMTLFGIYCFDNGKMHLQRLENSHNTTSKKNKLIIRRTLYKSYCFIFGSDRHVNVDYRGLLSRV